jgi:tetratricopeptide (TPR) repeat protein
VSTRRGLMTSLCMCLIFAASSGVAAANDPEWESSDWHDAAAPVEQSPARLGAIQEAMIQLYVMPRPSARAPLGRRIHPHPEAEASPADDVYSLDSRTRNSGSSGPANRDNRDSTSEVEGPATPPAGEAENAAGFLPGPYYYAPTPRRLPEHRRSFSDYRYFDGQPGRYGYGYNSYGFGDDYAGSIYRFGFGRGADYTRFRVESEERTQRALRQFFGHLARSLTLFHEGRYREAADGFKLAADTNHGDSAARLYCAHSLFAVGHYRDAVPFLRRAFELQPKVVFLNFDLRDDYGDLADFADHLDALEQALARSPQNLDRLILLGYVYYYTGQRDRAFGVLSTASRIAPRDPLVLRLLDNSRPPDVVLDDMKKESP